MSGLCASAYVARHLPPLTRQYAFSLLKQPDNRQGATKGSSRKGCFMQGAGKHAYEKCSAKPKNVGTPKRRLRARLMCNAHCRCDGGCMATVRQQKQWVVCVALCACNGEYDEDRGAHKGHCGLKGSGVHARTIGHKYCICRERQYRAEACAQR